jgi:hypothetical protein
LKDNNKKIPKWVEEKEKISNHVEPPLLMIGKLGVDFVKDGKLPNGDDYLWKKRRK